MKLVRRKLCLGQGKMNLLKDKEGNIINNFVDIAKAAEEFYTDLYSPQNSQDSFIRSSEELNTEASYTASDQVRRALQDMAKGKNAGKDGITVSLLIDEGDIMLDKLTF